MAPMAPEISYAIVNTNGRDFLLRCLAAIEEHHPAGVEREVLVLDNASDDGSAGAVRALDMDLKLIEREVRTGKAENDSLLLERARGEFCLLLNEDSELFPERRKRCWKRCAGMRRRAPPARSCSTPPATRCPARGASRV